MTVLLGDHRLPTMLDREFLQARDLYVGRWPLPITPKPAHETLAEFKDYLRRLAIAEELKMQRLAVYAAETAWLKQKGRPRDIDEAKAIAWPFWESYEAINRLWVPEDPVYSGTRAGVALSTTADSWTCTSGGSGQDRILEAFIGGEATASAVNRVAIQSSSAGTTPTNQTPELFSTRSPAAVSTFATAWSAAPSLTGNPELVLAFNAFGGMDRWVPAPGEEIYLVNGEKESCRSQSGTSTCSLYAVWEEL